MASALSVVIISANSFNWRHRRDQSFNVPRVLLILSQGVDPICSLAVEKLLVELLAFPKTRKLNFNVILTLSGKTDQISREIENSHRLPHVQNQECPHESQ